jgi:YrbI family 3-deoxy-D-manno-octulosonate 8-phosphate phosphatase
MHLTPDDRAALRGLRLLVFDFDGVFTDNAVWVREDGIEMVRCSREDGMGIGLVRKSGLGPEMIVLSTEENPVVTARCRKLRLRAVQGVEDKSARLDVLAAELGVSLAEIGYVGNDVNDRECLLRVGLPIVVADAHASVLGLGRLRTERNGGHGAVREVCDALLECRTLPAV